MTFLGHLVSKEGIKVNNSILYHPSKANMVVDALRRKAVSMGSLVHLNIKEKPLALDIQSLANRLVQFDVLDSNRVLAFIGARSSLIDQIWIKSSRMSCY